MIVRYDSPHSLARVDRNTYWVEIVAELGLAHILGWVPDDFARAGPCIVFQRWKHHFIPFGSYMEWLRLLGHPFVVPHIRCWHRLYDLFPVDERVIAARGRFTWTLQALDSGFIFHRCYIVGRSPRRAKRAERLVLLLTGSQVAFIDLHVLRALGGWLTLQPFGVLPVSSGRGTSCGWDLTTTALR